jgi:hypothetical protein
MRDYGGISKPSGKAPNMASRFATFGEEEDPRGQADALRNQKRCYHHKERSDISDIRRNLLNKNSSQGMIQCRHVLNNRSFWYILSANNIKP